MAEAQAAESDFTAFEGTDSGSGSDSDTGEGHQLVPLVTIGIGKPLIERLDVAGFGDRGVYDEDLRRRARRSSKGTCATAQGEELTISASRSGFANDISAPATTTPGSVGGGEGTAGDDAGIGHNWVRERDDPFAWGFDPFRFEEGNADNLPLELNATWEEMLRFDADRGIEPPSPQTPLLSVGTGASSHGSDGSVVSASEGDDADSDAVIVPRQPTKPPTPPLSTAKPTLFSKALDVLAASARTMSVERCNLIKFMTHVQKSYQSKANNLVNKYYHNWVHACDVLSTSASILFRLGMMDHCTELEQFAVLIASLCHDMEHPGLNNNFLTNTSSTLALRYSYVAPLENHSSSLTVIALRKYKLLEGLSRDQQKAAREKIIAAILSTDMASHFNLMGRFEQFVERIVLTTSTPTNGTRNRRGTLQSARALPGRSSRRSSVQNYREDELKLLCEFTVHCADVSNPCKPWHISKKWQTLVCLEFFEQGDLEQRSDLPISPNMDRRDTTEHSTAIGFINYVIGPLFRNLNQLLPQASVALNELSSNLKKWKDIERIANGEQPRPSPRPLSAASSQAQSPATTPPSSSPPSPVVGKRDLAKHESRSSYDHSELDSLNAPAHRMRQMSQAHYRRGSLDAETAAALAAQETAAGMARSDDDTGETLSSSLAHTRTRSRSRTRPSRGPPNEASMFESQPGAQPRHARSQSVDAGAADSAEAGAPVLVIQPDTVMARSLDSDPQSPRAKGAMRQPSAMHGRQRRSTMTKVVEIASVVSKVATKMKGLTRRSGHADSQRQNRQSLKENSSQMGEGACAASARRASSNRSSDNRSPAESPYGSESDAIDGDDDDESKYGDTAKLSCSTSNQSLTGQRPNLFARLDTNLRSPRSGRSQSLPSNERPKRRNSRRMSFGAGEVDVDVDQVPSWNEDRQPDAPADFHQESIHVVSKGLASGFSKRSRSPSAAEARIPETVSKAVEFISPEESSTVLESSPQTPKSPWSKPKVPRISANWHSRSQIGQLAIVNDVRHSKVGTIVRDAMQNHSTGAQFCVLAVVLFVLLGPEIRRMTDASPSSDNAWHTILWIALTVLVVELALRVLFMPGGTQAFDRHGIFQDHSERNLKDERDFSSWKLTAGGIFVASHIVGIVATIMTELPSCSPWSLDGSGGYGDAFGGGGTGNLGKLHTVAEEWTLLFTRGLRLMLAARSVRWIALRAAAHSAESATAKHDTIYEHSSHLRSRDHDSDSVSTDHTSFEETDDLGRCTRTISGGDMNRYSWSKEEMDDQRRRAKRKHEQYRQQCLSIGVQLAEVVARCFCVLLLLLSAVGPVFVPNSPAFADGLSMTNGVNASMANDAVGVLFGALGSGNLTLADVIASDGTGAAPRFIGCKVVYLRIGTTVWPSNVSTMPRFSASGAMTLATGDQHRRSDLLIFASSSTTPWQTRLVPIGLSSDDGENIVILDTSATRRQAATNSFAMISLLLLIMALAAHRVCAGAHNVVTEPLWTTLHVVERVALALHMLVHDDAGREYETEFLESAVTKMARLIQVGFGAAGTQIVRQHLGKKGELDLLASGRKIHAVFGFCDIRRFTDATEVLQERVMPFVNIVAHIVHYKVRRYDGNPNKNIGDAFLLVWKEDTEEESSRSPHDTDMTQIKIPAGAPEEVKNSGSASIKAALRSSLRGKRSSLRRSATARWSMADLRNHSVDSQEGDLSSVPQWLRQHPHTAPEGRVARPSWSARDEEAIEFAEVKDGIDLKYSTSRANNAIKAMVQVVYHLQHINACSGERLLAEIRKLGFHRREDEMYRKKKEQQIKSMIEMVRSELAPVRDDATNADIDDYHEISMGFGLHYGWAVEGAIGSSIKIDASYLSPHVNIASRLEAATKQYDVPLLLSGEIYERLSVGVQKRCRKLDSVTVKGSQDPVDLYTWDFLPMCNEHCGGGRRPLQGATDRVYVSPGFDMLQDLEAIDSYRKRFQNGVELYIRGNWEEAANIFHKCQIDLPQDKPPKVLLKHLARFNNHSPADWPGFRNLKEK